MAKRKKRYLHLSYKVPKKGKPKLKITPSDSPDKPLHPKKMITAALKAVRKVNRQAYTFRPDTLLVVGIDVANGRVLVKEVQGVHGGVAALIHHENMHREIEKAAHAYCLKERMRLGIYRKECNHPQHRIKKQRYVVNEVIRHGKVIETIYEHALFCTRCGAKMEAR